MRLLNALPGMRRFRSHHTSSHPLRLQIPTPLRRTWKSLTIQVHFHAQCLMTPAWSGMLHYHILPWSRHYTASCELRTKPLSFDAAAHWPPWFTKRHALWPIWCSVWPIWSWPISSVADIVVSRSRMPSFMDRAVDFLSFLGFAFALLKYLSVIKVYYVNY